MCSQNQYITKEDKKGQDESWPFLYLHLLFFDFFFFFAEILNVVNNDLRNEEEDNTK